MTYIQLAEKKYQLLDGLMELGDKYNWYNDVAVACQQLAEYSLKAAFEKTMPDNPSDSDIRLLGEHKLAPLARRLIQKYGYVFNVDDCVILQEYYFNARYPGEDFADVTQYDAKQAIEASRAIYNTVLGLLG